MTSNAGTTNTTTDNTDKSSAVMSASPAVGAAAQAEPSPSEGTATRTTGTAPHSTALSDLPGLADLFGFPAPVHRPRPRRCQWCEPQEAQVTSLREENPVTWVLHVLAEHVPQQCLSRVYVWLNHEVGKVQVHAHGHTFDQVDRIAEALDLFAQDVKTLPTGTAVAAFGSDHDAVTLHWYTELENVNPALTPDPTSYSTGQPAHGQRGQSE